MKVISARNVNDAWPAALDLINREGISRPSRNGPVLVHPEPVTTVYSHPKEHVLFDPVRNHNPVFAVHEALWMLAGRDDATFLDRYVSGDAYANCDGSTTSPVLSANDFQCFINTFAGGCP